MRVVLYELRAINTLTQSFHSLLYVQERMLFLFMGKECCTCGSMGNFA